MSRRKFNKEFKVAAVKLILDDKLPVYQVAKELSVHPNSLYRWVNEYEHYGESAFPGNGTKIYDYQVELHRLERRNRELEEEVEPLKNSGSSCRKKACKISVFGGTPPPIRNQEGLHNIENLTQMKGSRSIKSESRSSCVLWISMQKVQEEPTGTTTRNIRTEPALICCSKILPQTIETKYG